ncbi:MAG: substrate-binding domain-containing protein [Deltaproteobacteria bacterium]|nr:substrate-binding domain-containing protein [Deltaproteobacteria bacterium]
MKRFKYAIGTVLALAAFYLVAPFTAAAAGNSVTIAADPCSAPLIQKLAEAYTLKHRDFKAEVSTFSCTLGVYKAAKGEFEIGVSTQNGLTSNLPKGAVNRVVAKSPIVLIVNRTNTVNNLSYRDLHGILSGNIKNWKEVGGKDLEIKNVMLEPCVRHTISKQVVMYGENLATLLPGKKVNPVTYTNTMVEENEGAIGQQIYGYDSGNVLVLTIDGALPDEKTLGKTYTFYQDYNIVTRGEPAGAAKEFIEFVSSPEASDVMKSMKHVSN